MSRADRPTGRDARPRGRAGRPTRRAAAASRPVGVAGVGGLVVVLAVAGAAPTAGQARVRTSFDTTVVTVGDRIRMTVSIEHAPDAEIDWPDSLDLAPFEVLDARILDSRASADGRVSEIVLTLSAFELGELEIPSFDLEVVDATGARQTVATDRHGVEVVSVGADESGDIREIRGPLGLPIAGGAVLLTVLLVLILALLTFVLYRRFRPGAPPDEGGVRAPPPRPAHELALEALAALEASPLLEQGRVKEFHIEVSEVLRTYVERRFRVDALEMTTVEVLDGLERAGVDTEVRAGLRRFLEQCDLVKFAKARPDADASRRVLALGRSLVESTIPAVPIPDVDVAARAAGAGAGAGAGPARGGAVAVDGAEG